MITLKCDENKYPGYFSEFTEKDSSSPLLSVNYSKLSFTIGQ